MTQADCFGLCMAFECKSRLSPWQSKNGTQYLRNESCPSRRHWTSRSTVTAVYKGAIVVQKQVVLMSKSDSPTVSTPNRNNTLELCKT